MSSQQLESLDDNIQTSEIHIVETQMVTQFPTKTEDAPSPQKE